MNTFRAYLVYGLHSSPVRSCFVFFFPSVRNTRCCAGPSDLAGAN